MRAAAREMVGRGRGQQQLELRGIIFEFEAANLRLRFLPPVSCTFRSAESSFLANVRFREPPVTVTQLLVLYEERGGIKTGLCSYEMGFT